MTPTPSIPLTAEELDALERKAREGLPSRLKPEVSVVVPAITCLRLIDQARTVADLTARLAELQQAAYPHGEDGGPQTHAQHVALVVAMRADCDKIGEIAVEAESLRADLALAQQAPAWQPAVEAFLAQWDKAEKPINGAITIATVHGYPYTGPNLDAELTALRQLLAPSAPTKGL